jgi:hypothetical protein
MNLLNARLDLQSSLPISGKTDEWQLTSTFFDAYGVFSVAEVQPNDVIYNDSSMISGVGVVRLLITSIVSAVGATLVCNVKWDMDAAQPAEASNFDYPVSGAMTIIGRPGELGTITATSMSANGVDESFMSMVRNIESQRIGQRVAHAEVGMPADGNLLDGAVPLSSTSKVADAIDDLNEAVKNLSDYGTF